MGKEISPFFFKTTFDQENRMKILLSYFSRTGYTYLLAHAIERELKSPTLLPDI